MILRLLLLTIVFLLANQKAFAHTVVLQGYDQDGRVHFYTGTDEYSAKTAEERAKSECLNMGMRFCQIYHEFKRRPDDPPECLATVTQPWPPGLDTITFAVAPTLSEAISSARAKCKDASCKLGAALCDSATPVSSERGSTTPTSSVKEILPRRVDVGIIAKIIDHVYDDLKTREALLFYTVAFGFALFVLLTLYDVITNDRRSLSRWRLISSSRAWSRHVL
jgi:hypothetical protein